MSAERPYADIYRQAIEAGISRQRIHEFRRMAEYWDHPEIAALVETGPSRRQVLLAIDRIEGKSAPARPTCPTCGQEVRP